MYLPFRAGAKLGIQVGLVNELAALSVEVDGALVVGGGAPTRWTGAGCELREATQSNCTQHTHRRRLPAMLIDFTGSELISSEKSTKRCINIYH